MHPIHIRIDDILQFFRTVDSQPLLHLTGSDSRDTARGLLYLKTIKTGSASHQVYDASPLSIGRFTIYTYKVDF